MRIFAEMLTVTPLPPGPAVNPGWLTGMPFSLHPPTTTFDPGRLPFSPLTDPAGRRPVTAPTGYKFVQDITGQFFLVPISGKQCIVYPTLSHYALILLPYINTLLISFFSYFLCLSFLQVTHLKPIIHPYNSSSSRHFLSQAILCQFG